MNPAITPALPAHIRMRIARAIEQSARFDASEEKFRYVLTATVDLRKRVIFETELFAEMHQAITCLLEFRERGTEAERKRQRKSREDMAFYRHQRKARETAKRETRVSRLRRKFYGSAA
jgi:uncharacterized protein YcsI (UPF0317 family)